MNSVTLIKEVKQILGNLDVKKIDLNANNLENMDILCPIYTLFCEVNPKSGNPWKLVNQIKNIYWKK